MQGGSLCAEYHLVRSVENAACLLGIRRMLSCHMRAWQRQQHYHPRPSHRKPFCHKNIFSTIAPLQRKGDMVVYTLTQRYNMYSAMQHFRRILFAGAMKSALGGEH